jgi:hypothetical protein
MAEECPGCNRGKLVNVRKEGNAVVKEFSCGHRLFEITLEETVGVADGLRLRLKGSKGEGTREIVRKITNSFERRKIIEKLKRETRVVFIMDLKRGQLSHIHCKICGNEWRDSEREDVNQKFDITQKEEGIFWVKCRKCGKEAITW